MSRLACSSLHRSQLAGLYGAQCKGLNCSLQLPSASACESRGTACGRGASGAASAPRARRPTLSSTVEPSKNGRPRGTHRVPLAAPCALVSRSSRSPTLTRSPSSSCTASTLSPRAGSEHMSLVQVRNHRSHPSRTSPGSLVAIPAALLPHRRRPCYRRGTRPPRTRPVQGRACHLLDQLDVTALTRPSRSSTPTSTRSSAPTSRRSAAATRRVDPHASVAAKH